MENKSNKTQAEEALLADKKQELEKLLAEKNKSNTNSAKPKDKTALYLSLGIAGIVLVGLVVILVRKGKFSKFLFRQSKDKKRKKH